MNTKYLFKDEFAVIGKAGQGPANNPMSWILPLWDEANKNFDEIRNIVFKNENDTPYAWGAMNDINEQNKRWNKEGKYMAAFETDKDTIPPTGWSKWIIPAQTYLVASCTMETYVETFSNICADPDIKIVGTVHEYYPEPGNSNILELYFPIFAGNQFVSH